MRLTRSSAADRALTSPSPRSLTLSRSRASVVCLCETVCASVCTGHDTVYTDPLLRGWHLREPTKYTRGSGQRAASLSLSMPHIPSDRALVVAPPTPSPPNHPRPAAFEARDVRHSRTHAARRLSVTLSDRDRAGSSAASPPHHTRLRGVVRGRVGIRGSRGRVVEVVTSVYARSRGDEG